MLYRWRARADFRLSRLKLREKRSVRLLMLLSCSVADTKPLRGRYISAIFILRIDPGRMAPAQGRGPDPGKSRRFGDPDWGARGRSLKWVTPPRKVALSIRPSGRVTLKVGVRELCSRIACAQWLFERINFRRSSLVISSHLAVRLIYTRPGGVVSIPRQFLFLAMLANRRSEVFFSFGN
jgi:hypothetical protein